MGVYLVFVDVYLVFVDMYLVFVVVFSYMEVCILYLGGSILDFLVLARKTILINTFQCIPYIYYNAML